MIIGENRSLKYTSSLSVMLVYFKLIDDWNDDKSVKALVGNIPFKMSIEKARKENPQIFDFIKEKLEEISNKLQGDKKIITWNELVKGNQ